MHTNEFKALSIKLNEFARVDLRSELKARGYSIKDICFALSIERQTYYRKDKAGTWDLDEILILLHFLSAKRKPKKFRKTIKKCN